MGSPTLSLSEGGMSMPLRWSFGVSYLMTEPALVTRGSSGRYWYPHTEPSARWAGISKPGTLRWYRSNPRPSSRFLVSTDT